MVNGFSASGKILQYQNSSHSLLGWAQNLSEIKKNVQSIYKDIQYYSH